MKRRNRNKNVAFAAIDDENSRRTTQMKKFGPRKSSKSLKRVNL